MSGALSDPYDLREQRVYMIFLKQRIRQWSFDQYAKDKWLLHWQRRRKSLSQLRLELHKGFGLAQAFQKYLR